MIDVCVCVHMSKLKIHLLLYDHLFIYYMLYHTVIHCLMLGIAELRSCQQSSHPRTPDIIRQFDMGYADELIYPSNI